MSFEADLQQKIDAAVADLDERALEQLLEDHYQKTEEAEKPFDAAIELRPEFRAQLSEAALESDAALNWANRIARARRYVAYQLKRGGGFNGMVIVEEGDSWFQYPLLLDDVIDQLSADPDKAILSLSGAGDLVEDMARRKEYLDALRGSGARVMLLSGGGNDLLGEGRFAKFLLPYKPGATARDVLNFGALEQDLRHAVSYYLAVLEDVRKHHPNVRVLGHAYDIPYPEAGGRWLGGPLDAKGIPHDLGREVIGLILDRFGQYLRRAEELYPNFTFLDLRGKVDRGKQSWHDELHPKNPGYGRAADEFRKALAQLATDGAFEAATQSDDVVAIDLPAVALPEAARAGGSVIVLDPGHGGTQKLGGSSWNNAIGPRGTLEKTLTLDVAQRARTALESRGHRVILTREDDRNLGLGARAGVARDAGADVFVSIHFNGSAGHNAQGTETFVHTRNAPASRRLCRTVQAAMVAALGLRDRNAGHPDAVKEAGYGVLNPASHGPDTACVLHEVSFLDRTDEEARLQSPAYLDRIATALADGIDAYLAAGFESDAMEAGEGIGDAIELSAQESGLTVVSYLGFAQAAPAVDWQAPAPGPVTMAGVGGNALPDDGAEMMAMDPGAPSLAVQIAENLARQRALMSAAASGDDSYDENEFAQVGIGAGFDPVGGSFESNVASLEAAFANVATQGFDFAQFDAFIAQLGLRNFAAGEFLVMGSSNAPGGSCAGLNRLPPRDLWPNIANSALMIDEIRHRLNAPVRILSCYRAPDYNRCIGGARASQHMRFNAIDWHCDTGGPREWERVAMQVRDSDPRFRGWIGRYDRQGFVHIDTRG